MVVYGWLLVKAAVLEFFEVGALAVQDGMGGISQEQQQVACEG